MPVFGHNGKTVFTFGRSTHSGTAHVPRPRTFFILPSEGLYVTSSIVSEAQFACEKGSVVKVIRINHLHDVNRALHSQFDGPQRAHLRRPQGHHQQLDNPVYALSHNEPVWLPGRTSLNYNMLARSASSNSFRTLLSLESCKIPNELQAECFAHLDHKLVFR